MRLGFQSWRRDDCSRVGEEMKKDQEHLYQEKRKNSIKVSENNVIVIRDERTGSLFGDFVSCSFQSRAINLIQYVP
jgi:hypothetical protein